MLLGLVLLLLFKFNGVLVVIHEHLELVHKHLAGLIHGVIRRDAAIRPNLQSQAVVIGALADTGVAHIVTYAGHG